MFQVMECNKLDHIPLDNYKQSTGNFCIEKQNSTSHCDFISKFFHIFFVLIVSSTLCNTGILLIIVCWCTRLLLKIIYVRRSNDISGTDAKRHSIRDREVNLSGAGYHTILLRSLIKLTQSKKSKLMLPKKQPCTSKML